jgi:uncharacterized membrane protein YbhN (UPF0104 family)
MGALRRLLERRAAPLSGRAQLVVVVVTTAVLAVAAVWAWRSADFSLAGISWWPIAVAFFAVAPATLVLKMFEYDAAGRIIGSRAPWRRALEVSVVSAAANLLPIPGSLVVTTRSLSEQGSTYGTAAVASTIPGLAWLGLSGVIGGIAIMIAGAPLVGALVTVGGAVAAAAAWTMLRRTARRHDRGRLAVRIAVIECGWIVLSGLRFWLLLRALGISATAAQSLALAVAGAMSVAIGFMPGGLGVREALIALLSPLIDLSLSDGVVLGVIDRIVWITFLSVAALVVAATRARSAGQAGEDPAEVPGEHVVGEPVDERVAGSLRRVDPRGPAQGS